MHVPEQTVRLSWVARRIVVSGFVALMAGLHAVGATLVPERIALVIGNARYTQVPLRNPVHDARAMTSLLQRAGFQVDQRLDATRDELRDAARRFSAAIGQPQVQLALLYYAGHGVQLDWRNYLLPVGSNVRNADDLRREAVDVSEFVQAMQQNNSQKSLLVILDACRDNPFGADYRPAAPGLTQFDAPAGSLLAYATGPGKVAMDGAGINGLYTSHLLKEMAVEGARLDDIFKRVRLGVWMASRGQQVPWELSSLFTEDVYLYPTKRQQLTEAERESLLDEELRRWAQVKTSNAIDPLVDFIRQFPSGSTSEIAQARLSRMLALRDDTERQQMQVRRQHEAEQLALAQRNAAEEAKRQAEEQRQREKRQRAEREASEAAAQQQRKQQQAAQQEAQAKLTQQLLAQAQADAAAKARAKAIELANEQAQAKAEADARASAEAQEMAQASRQRRREISELAAIAPSSVSSGVALTSGRSDVSQAGQRPDGGQVALSPAGEAVARPSLPPDNTGGVTTLAPTPHFHGYDLHDRRYRVGDAFHFRILDGFSGRELAQEASRVSTPMALQVTAVDEAADRVEFNGGQYVTDLMGNTVKHLSGTFSEPRQFYPAELVVGKRWVSEFRQMRDNGLRYTFRYKLKVAARESITVPAGTFNAYRIEAEGFNIQLGAQLSRKIWIVPGISADIASETLVRLRNGNINQFDRQELVRYSVVAGLK